MCVQNYVRKIAASKFWEDATGAGWRLGQRQFEVRFPAKKHFFVIGGSQHEK
jgi:hypothetical protein